MKQIIAIVLAVFAFSYSQILLASVPTNTGWTPGVVQGNTLWFGPGNQTKTSLSMGQAIWDSSVSSGGSRGLTTTAKLRMGAAEAVVVAKGAVTGVGVFAAFKAIAGGPVGVGLTVLMTAPAIIDWLNQKGVTATTSPNSSPVFSKVDNTVCTVAPCNQYRYGAPLPWANTREAACSVLATQGNGIYFNAQSATGRMEGGSCYLTFVQEGGQTSQSSPMGFQSQPIEPVTNPSPKIMTIEQIRAEMENIPVMLPVINAILDAGGSLPIAYAPGGTTGPASVNAVPVVSTTVGPNDTTVTTSTTKTNLDYSTGTSPTTGTQVPKVTGTTTTTTVTNVTNNITGETTTSSNTTNNPAPQPDPNTEEQKDECEAHPNRAGCADLDTPDGEIPKTEKTVSYTPQTPFGGGSCPADKYQTLHTGQVLKVVDWATPCGYIADYVRPVLILLGSWMAMMLLIPGRTES